MSSPSASRDRGRDRERSVDSRSGRRRRYDSPASPSPPPSRSRSRSRSPSRSRSWTPPSRRNGRYRTRSRSYRSDHSRSPSRSISRSPRGRSISREGSQLPVRSTKIVVERLTKNITEDHLREVFGSYGPIQDLDLPVNRTHGTNRGTAYILFIHESDAEAAIAHMHEGILDGAVINVSIVLPKRKMSPAPPTARRGANINPLVPPPIARGPPMNDHGGGIGGHGSFGSRGTHMGPGSGAGAGRRRPSPGRYGPRSDAWRPRSGSQSPPRVLGGAPPSRGGGRGRGGRYRRRSRSPSYSRSPPRRRDSRGRRRSPSYDSYRDRSRS